MQALPDLGAAKSEQTTGITCPDCPGVLQVKAENGHLRFRCRIGHVYSLQDLIESKERRLEDLLWAPVTALDELTALLREVVAQGRAAGIEEQCEERAARAQRLATAIRQIIEQNEPTDLRRDVNPEPGTS